MTRAKFTLYFDTQTSHTYKSQNSLNINVYQKRTMYKSNLCFPVTYIYTQEINEGTRDASHMHVCVYVYVCMYVCMYVRMYVCMYVSSLVCKVIKCERPL